MCQPDRHVSQDPPATRRALYLLSYQLENWRLRGKAARAARQPREAPWQPASTPFAIRVQRIEAWLAGYDEKGRR